MSDDPKLSSLTYVGFSANAALDAGHGSKVSFEEIYLGIERGTLLQDLNEKIPGEFDFSMYTIGQPDEGRKLIGVLLSAAEALRGRERRKVGVENSGLSLLVAAVFEAIQQGKWISAHRTSPAVLN